MQLFYCLRIIGLSAVLVSGCSRRNKEVCCTTIDDCAKLDLPASEVGNRGCEQGMSCIDLMCVATPTDASVADAIGDAHPDAPWVGRCDPVKPFGAPTIVPNVNTGYQEEAFALTSDELTAYLVRDTDSVFSLTSTTRASREVDFPADQDDPDIASFNHAVQPWSTRDSHRIFYRGLAATPYESSRGALSEAYPAGTKLTVDNAYLTGVTIIGASPDALRFYWTDSSMILKFATNVNTPDSYEGTTQIASMAIRTGVLSADELTLYYNPPNADGIFVSQRANLTTAFDPGIAIASLGFTPGDVPKFVTADQCLLYFQRVDGNDAGNIYVTRRPH